MGLRCSTLMFDHLFSDISTMSTQFLLFFGHSWVADLQREYDSREDVGFRAEFISYPGANVECLTRQIHGRVRREHTHVVLSVVLTSACERRFIGGAGSPAWVSVADASFTPESFHQKLLRLVGEIRKQGPQIRVLVILPPQLDLFHYNTVLLRGDRDAAKRFRQDLTMGAFALNRAARGVFGRTEALLESQFAIENGEYISGAVLAERSGVDTRRLQDFRAGHLATLGRTGYLRDGIHPSSAYAFLLLREIKLRVGPSVEADPSVAPAEEGAGVATPASLQEVGEDFPPHERTPSRIEEERLLASPEPMVGVVEGVNEGVSGSAPARIGETDGPMNSPDVLPISGPDPSGGQLLPALVGARGESLPSTSRSAHPPSVPRRPKKKKNKGRKRQEKSTQFAARKREERRRAKEGAVGRARTGPPVPAASPSASGAGTSAPERAPESGESTQASGGDILRQRVGGPAAGLRRQRQRAGRRGSAAPGSSREGSRACPAVLLGQVAEHAIEGAWRSLRGAMESLSYRVSRSEGRRALQQALQKFE